MKVLVIGDPHFKRDNSTETDQLFSEVEKLLSSNPVDFIVVLGDVLDTFRKIDLMALHRATLFLKMLEEKCQTLYILVGNHDRIDQTDFLSDFSPFTALKWWPSTRVVTTPLVENGFLFVPYVQPGRFHEAIKGIDLGEIQCIWCHQEFKGAKMGMFISEGGDVYPDDFPPAVSGHIHDYDELQHNLIYTGTPFSHSFGDDTIKRVFIFSFENGEIEFESFVLNIRKKKIVTILLEEIFDFTPEENVLIRLNIVGNLEKINNYLKLPSLSHLQSPNILIRPCSDGVEEGVVVKSTITPSKFVESLKIEIHKHPKVEKEAKELFSDFL